MEDRKDDEKHPMTRREKPIPEFGPEITTSRMTPVTAHNTKASVKVIVTPDKTVEPHS